MILTLSAWLLLSGIKDSISDRYRLLLPILARSLSPSVGAGALLQAHSRSRIDGYINNFFIAFIF